MKVIGKTTNGFILEASEAEVNSLLATEDPRKGKVKDKIEVGTELSFTVALNNLGLLKDISLSDNYSTLRHLKDARDKLLGVIEKVEGLEAPLVSLQNLAKERKA